MSSINLANLFDTSLDTQCCGIVNCIESMFLILLTPISNGAQDNLYKKRGPRSSFFVQIILPLHGLRFAFGRCASSGRSRRPCYYSYKKSALRTSMAEEYI